MVSIPLDTTAYLSQGGPNHWVAATSYHHSLFLLYLINATSSTPQRVSVITEEGTKAEPNPNSTSK